MRGQDTPCLREKGGSKGGPRSILHLPAPAGGVATDLQRGPAWDVRRLPRKARGICPIDEDEQARGFLNNPQGPAPARQKKAAGWKKSYWLAPSPPSIEEKPWQGSKRRKEQGGNCVPEAMKGRIQSGSRLQSKMIWK